MLYYDPKPLRIPKNGWTGILNVFDNAGFITGIKDNKLLISWFTDLKDISLLENYNDTKSNTII